MPVVTTITRQKRHDTRYSISIDGTYAFALSDLELSNSGLRIGTELSAAEVENWQRLSGESKAYNLALRYIGIRQRSTTEIRTYLKRKGWEEETSEAVVERLRGLGLIDDAAFAAAWVRERQLLRPRSTQALRFELMKLGVGRDDIDTALQDNQPDEVAALVELIERRQSRYADRNKLMAYLARQGFSYDKIKQAFATIEE